MKRTSSNLDDRRRLLEDELIDFDEPEPHSGSTNNNIKSNGTSNDGGELSILQATHANLKGERLQRVKELKEWARQEAERNPDSKSTIGLSQMETHPVGAQFVAAWRAAKKQLSDFEEAYPEVKRGTLS